MSKEDKPLEYQRRIRDTKGVAQRLDLGYLKRAAAILLIRKRLTWALVAGALLASRTRPSRWIARSTPTRRCGAPSVTRSIAAKRGWRPWATPIARRVTPTW